VINKKLTSLLETECGEKSLTSLRLSALSMDFELLTLNIITMYNMNKKLDYPKNNNFPRTKGRSVQCFRQQQRA
jgi:hypothetical protein